MTDENKGQPLFDLGRLITTPGVLEAMSDWQEVWGLLERHVHGDWGIVGGENAVKNDRAVASGDDIFSTYRLKDGTRVWVITRADRSATTILLPEEY